MHPRFQNWHAIDYVTVCSHDCQGLLDVKVLKGIEYWTDPRLLETTFKMKIKIESKHPVSHLPKHINVSKLKKS